MRDNQTIGWLLHSWGELAQIQGDAAAAQARLEKSVDLFRRQGNERGLAVSLYNLGYVAQHAGDGVRMAGCFGESLRRFWRLQHQNGFAIGIAGMCCSIRGSAASATCRR